MFHYAADLSLSGPTSTVYTVEVTGSSGTSTPVTKTANFELEMLNPCLDAAYVSIQSVSLPAGLFYGLYGYEPIPNGYKFQHRAFVVKTVPVTH